MSPHQTNADRKSRRIVISTRHRKSKFAACVARQHDDDGAIVVTLKMYTKWMMAESDIEIYVLLKYSLFFSSTLVLTSSIDVVFIFSIREASIQQTDVEYFLTNQIACGPLWFIIPLIMFLVMVVRRMTMIIVATEITIMRRSPHFPVLTGWDWVTCFWKLWLKYLNFYFPWMGSFLLIYILLYIYIYT